VSIAALVKTLLAAGVDHDVIVAAVESVETRPVDAQAERRRAADRERKRAKGGIPQNSADSADVPLSPLVPPSLSPEPLNPPPYNPPNPTLRPKRVRTDAGADFDDFWKAYPTDPLMSKKRAAGEWVKLDAEDRGKARRACDPFRDYCASHPDYRPVHAERFLSQRRFDGFQPTTSPTATGPPEGVPVFATDEEFQEWWAKRRGVA
jgi:hypothetical protein